MLTQVILKMMASKILGNLLLSETCIAGGPKVNLINEERGTHVSRDAQKGYTQKKGKIRKPTRESVKSHR